MKYTIFTDSKKNKFNVSKKIILTTLLINAFLITLNAQDCPTNCDDYVNSFQQQLYGTTKAGCTYVLTYDEYKCNNGVTEPKNVNVYVSPPCNSIPQQELDDILTKVKADLTAGGQTFYIKEGCKKWITIQLPTNVTTQTLFANVNCPLFANSGPEVGGFDKLSIQVPCDTTVCCMYEEGNLDCATTPNKVYTPIGASGECQDNMNYTVFDKTIKCLNGNTIHIKGNVISQGKCELFCPRFGMGYYTEEWFDDMFDKMVKANPNNKEYDFIVKGNQLLLGHIDDIHTAFLFDLSGRVMSRVSENLENGIDIQYFDKNQIYILKILLKNRDLIERKILFNN